MKCLFGSADIDKQYKINSNIKERRKIMCLGIVYKAENLVSKKVYIGQTVSTLEKRIYHHYYSLRYNINNYFKNSLNKYKKEDWNWEIIDTAETIEDLNKKEEMWIKHYNSTDRLLGYNSIEGGGNRKFNKELKEKLSVSQNKRFENEEERNKIRQSLKEYRDKNPKILKEHSEKIKELYKNEPERIEDHSKCMKKYYSNENNRKKLSEIKKEMHRQHPEKAKEQSKRMIEFYKNNPQLKEKKYKKVKCLETNKQYDSIKSAGNDLKILPSNISAVCRGKRKSTHGLTFEFI